MGVANRTCRSASFGQSTTGQLTDSNMMNQGDQYGMEPDSFDNRSLSLFPEASFSSVSSQCLLQTSSALTAMGMPCTSSPVSSPTMTEHLPFNQDYPASTASLEDYTTSPLMSDQFFDPMPLSSDYSFDNGRSVFPFACSNAQGESSMTTSSASEKTNDWWNVSACNSVGGYSGEVGSLPSPPLSPPSLPFSSAMTDTSLNSASTFPESISPLSPEELSPTFQSCPTFDGANFDLNGYESKELSMADAISMNSMYSALEQTTHGLPSTQLSMNEPVLAAPLENTENVQSSLRRSSSEGNSGLARADPLYKASPLSDGLYRCPFKSRDECTHQPTKLKCTYDKYVDSHLRPYRCKNASCTELQFSSTACLLRHEREAHGMHGHGEKPHLCQYPDCDRALAENGFPRRWNLYDHMRRVHGYKDPAPSSKGSSSPTSSHGGTRPQKAVATTKKTKAGRVAKSVAVKRTKSVASVRSNIVSAKPPSPELRPGQSQNMHREWIKYKNLLAENLRSLEAPSDWTTHEQLIADMNILNSIGVHYRRAEAGQVPIAQSHFG
ncbi:MAG: hypothetical protein M1834_002182 [Cirrosporium novae-zelandiae]|nr:MAG: hypothetical protein M1834_002182 [Cirrosporium novae-zelandiae]